MYHSAITKITSINLHRSFVQHIRVSWRKTSQMSRNLCDALRLRSATKPGAAKGVLRGSRTHQSLPDLDSSKLVAYHGLPWQMKPTRLSSSNNI